MKTPQDFSGGVRRLARHSTNRPVQVIDAPNFWDISGDWQVFTCIRAGGKLTDGSFGKKNSPIVRYFQRRQYRHA
jgi:hypothetical protein